MIANQAVEKRFKAYYDCLNNADPLSSPIISNYILIKLASRCNLACTYCYWFRDETVLEAPKRLTVDAEDAFIARLREHIDRYHLESFFILFHGGEPLLFGKARFDVFCDKLRRLEVNRNFELKLAITTNGILIDEDWANLFRRWRVSVTVSIDGPRSVNDRRRIGFHGEGSFDAIIRGIEQLREARIEPGFLSVCDPNTNPSEYIRFFAEDLGAKDFDVLVPDATNDDTPSSIAPFYLGLFDSWWDLWIDHGIRIRFLETLVKGLLGEESRVESIGFGPNTTSTLTTDGAIEPLDVLRVAGNNFTRTRIDVFRNNLQDIQSDPLWQEVLRSSLTLPETCRECRYHITCGGGHIGQRWSSSRRFDNPTVYCQDVKTILAHISRRLFDDLTVTVPRKALDKVGVAV